MFNQSINLAILCGRLGRDPEVRTTPNGTAVANLSIATSKKWKDKNTGEQQESSEWHRVVVWGKRAEIIENHFHKGDVVYVQGELQTEKWTDREGVEKYTTKIVLNPFGGDIQKMPGSPKGGAPSQPQGQAAPSQDTAPDFDEDDIPF